MTAKIAEILIYIVDDDDAVRDSLRILLESHGMAVEDFASTEEFIAAYRPHPNSCLMLDLHLPVVGGLDFLASRNGAEMDIPVIMMTGRSDESTRARAHELGAVAFLEKPIGDGELIDAINLAVNREACH
ncbi:MAG TPA: response regulator [Stellaceae bacterium]|nr:response regulator [Stellaceae bacterium]